MTKQELIDEIKKLVSPKVYQSNEEAVKLMLMTLPEIYYQPYLFILMQGVSMRNSVKLLTYICEVEIETELTAEQICRLIPNFRKIIYLIDSV